MSKKSKAAGREKRLKEKRSRKAAMRAQYQKYAELGQNSKSKRSRSKKIPKQLTTANHPLGKCGNPGCVACFGVNFKPFLENAIPKNMPPWMFKRWKENSDVSLQSQAR